MINKKLLSFLVAPIILIILFSSCTKISKDSSSENDDVLFDPQSIVNMEYEKGEDESDLNINCEYPFINIKGIDSIIGDYIRYRVKEFKQASQDNDTYPNDSLSVKYDLSFADQGIFNVCFKEKITLGEQELNYYEAKAFSAKDEGEYALKDLFPDTDSYLDIVSQKVKEIADLTEKYDSEKTLKSTTPQEQNFSDFIIKNDSIDFAFDPGKLSGKNSFSEDDFISVPKRDIEEHMKLGAASIKSFDPAVNAGKTIAVSSRETTTTEAPTTSTTEPVTEPPSTTERQEAESTTTTTVTTTAAPTTTRSSGGASSGKKVLALTFDDGPGQYTGKLLDALKAKNAKATFFVLGSCAKNYPKAIKRMHSEGHEIASHTYNHKDLSKCSVETINKQINDTDNIVENLTGKKTSLLRPPYGSYNDKVKANVNKPLIMWNVDTLDWKYKNKNRIKEHILSHAADGNIILLHDIHPLTVDAAIEAIDELQKAGYELVTVSQLFQMKGIALKSGQAYSSAKR